MHFSMRSVALVALSLATYASAGPVVKAREVQVQERAADAAAPGNAANLLNNISALTAILTTANAAISGLQTTSGVTVSTVGNVVASLGTVVGGINGVISSALTTTGGITATEYNTLQSAFTTLANAFVAYIKSLQLAALSASVVYSADQIANNAAAAAALTTAAASKVVGGAVGSILGAAAGLVGGVITPVTNAAVTTALQGAGCLVKAVNGLITPMTAAVNSVAGGVVTPVAGVQQVANTIPTVAAPLAGALAQAIQPLLNAGVATT